jgi:mono/diheme cytochrome c family protein
VTLPAFAADAREQFETEVRPLLAKRCWSCHGQAGMGGLHLDSLAGILKGGKSGPAIVPGKPADSLLVQAITYTHEGLRMPPQGKLPDEEIAILKSWVEHGAYWPPSDAPTPAKRTGEYVITPEQRAFWSFQPVKKPAIPPVKNATWTKSPIDHFVLSRLEQKGLQPVAAADKRTLIRRATFDLTGLPPTPEEVNDFIKDKSPDAFAHLVDRLLASPRYGERWGRYWLDVARYADDKFNSTQEDPYPNSFRYRDWVIKAFNDDMPYDMFVKAQIAGDEMPADDPLRYSAGLGFYALSPEMQDDRVDATTRGFLGLTVACAQCHDHKFDPIPTKDFYSLQGVFSSTELHETPLAPKDVVERWQAQKKKVDHQQEVIDRFYSTQREQIAEILAAQTARFLMASRGLESTDGLDAETLERWRKYLQDPHKDHPFLKKWFELVAAKAPEPALRQAADEFRDHVIAINEEKREVDEKNKITLGLNPSRNTVANASLASLDRDKYMLWRDLFEKSSKDAAGFFKTPDGVYYYGKGTIERFLQGEWRDYLAAQEKELERLKKELPEKYPFLETIADDAKPADIHVAIRGDRNNPGEIAPRRFLKILSPGEAKPFAHGTGRLELAEAIADPKNPLTARVIVNRIWQHHFGRGIVDTPSNFGQLGGRPTHPLLLDYLAARFVENGWSIKSLHHEIMLSAVYQLSAANDTTNMQKDPANQFLWRANRQRLDAESLRDAILFVSGSLDVSMGGKAAALDKDCKRRTVYGFVSRRKLDGMLALFDFPNPNNTSESRMMTNVPLQRLYLMNSEFVEEHSHRFADRFTGSEEQRIRGMYRTLFGRDPDAEELKLGLAYVKHDAWPSYARALLASNEFIFID